jgi:hypothetical protein
MVKTFAIRRSSERGHAATTLDDVKRFVEQHRESSDLIVEINRAGPGDGFADYMEAHGLTVRRIPIG